MEGDARPWRAGGGAGYSLLMPGTSPYGDVRRDGQGNPSSTPRLCGRRQGKVVRRPASATALLLTGVVALTGCSSGASRAAGPTGAGMASGCAAPAAMRTTTNVGTFGGVIDAVGDGRSDPG